MSLRSKLLFLTLLSLIFFDSALSQDPNSYEVITGDFNGDGKMDFIRRKTGGWASDGIDTAEIFYASDNRTKFTQKILNPDFDIGSEVTNLFVADFDNDGKDDILRQEKGARVAFDTIRNATNTCVILFSTGEDFTQYVLDETYFLNGELSSLIIGDYNGDGYPDIFKIIKRTTNPYGYRDGTQLMIGGFAENFTFTSSAPNLDYYAVDYNLTNFMVADFNGDGRDDLFRQEKGAWAQDRLHTAFILLAGADSSLSSVDFSKYNLPEYYDLKGDYTNILFGDFNGDGYADIIRKDTRDSSENAGSYIFLSLISGQFYAAILPDSLALKNNNTKLFVGDFNGDGTSDLLRQTTGDTSMTGNKTIQTFISNGTDFIKYAFSEWWRLNGNYSKLLIGDFDGDTRDDILQYWGTDNVYIHYPFAGEEIGFDSLKIDLRRDD